MIRTGRQSEQLCWSEPWTRFSAPTGWPARLVANRGPGGTRPFGWCPQGPPRLSGLDVGEDVCLADAGPGDRGVPPVCPDRVDVGAAYRDSVVITDERSAAE